MQRVDISTRERISTQAGAMDLNAGRLILAEAVKLFVVSAGAWLLVVMGLLLVGLMWGGDRYEWHAVRLMRYAVGGFGAGLATLAAGAAGASSHILIRGWYRYAARLEEWHRAELRAYRAAGGQVVDRSYTVRALTIQEPAHVVLVALALAERARREEGFKPSVETLRGDVWLGRVKVGELSKPTAEEFARALHQVGLLKGRKAGYAGQLTTVDPGEIIELVTTRAGRIRQLDQERPAAAGEEE